MFLLKKYHNSNKHHLCLTTKIVYLYIYTKILLTVHYDNFST